MNYSLYCYFHANNTFFLGKLLAFQTNKNNQLHKFEINISHHNFIAQHDKSFKIEIFNLLKNSFLHIAAKKSMQNLLRYYLYTK